MVVRRSAINTSLTTQFFISFMRFSSTAAGWDRTIVDASSQWIPIFLLLLSALLSSGGHLLSNSISSRFAHLFDAAHWSLPKFRHGRLTVTSSSSPAVSWEIFPSKLFTSWGHHQTLTDFIYISATLFYWAFHRTCGVSSALSVVRGANER